MRVLWLTFTPTVNPENQDSELSERGWITSLEDKIKKFDNIQLGIGFFQSAQCNNFVSDNIHYYPIQMKYQNTIGKIYQRLFSKLYDSNPDRIKEIIDDFKPDVIHLFGTESGMVEVLDFSTVPVIVHLQGLVRPYLSAWFPKGMSQSSVYFNSSIPALLFLAGYPFEYKLFKKRAIREDKAIQKAKYFFGRTNWDKQYLDLLKPNYTYFHCEELLRTPFNNHQWRYLETRVFKVVSVINPQIYKGLEMVLETASILKSASINFEWHVVGVSHADELVTVTENASNLKFADFNVSFKGIKSCEALIAELLSAALFVHPSHIENSPNSVCEAMLLGMPVIAGNVGGNDSIINHEENGILFKSYDAYDLAYTIKRATENPEAFVLLGKNARVKALRRHDSETVASTVVNSYRQVINNPAHYESPKL